MSRTERPAQPAGGHQARDLNRRNFLGVAGAAGSAALGGLSTRSSGAAPPPESAMVLQVARAGAVFPIDFPSFGEPGSASSRATMTRLRAAARRTSAPRQALARAGARLLIASGLLDQPRERLLDGIGRLASDGGSRPDLTATVALAIAAVSRHFDPNSDEAARVWIDGLRWQHQLAPLAGRGAR